MNDSIADISTQRLAARAEAMGKLNYIALRVRVKREWYMVTFEKRGSRWIVAKLASQYGHELDGLSGSATLAAIARDLLLIDVRAGLFNAKRGRK